MILDLASAQSKILLKIVSNIHKGLENTALNGLSIEIIYTLLFVLTYSILAIVLYYISRRVLLRIISTMFEKSRSRYDDFLVSRGVLSRLTYLVPLIFIYSGISFAFKYLPTTANLLENILLSLIIFVTLMISLALIRALGDIYDIQPYSKNRPIRGYLQGIQLLVSIFAVLGIISVFFELKMTAIFTSLGAVAAVVLLVFRDTILSFVASIQLLANNMVKPGDWISMPSRNTDGTVLEMNLNTVKIQNWDKTISTIPTYALVTESFTNWKGMEESGGRRIKRSISIDMRSICFCSEDMLERFRQIEILRPYIDEKTKELAQANAEINMSSTKVNGQRLTNIGVFRRYLELYLHNHPMIHDEMTFLVRQLQSTERGLPIEIYVFCKDQRWAQYESIQSDIFDHIFAILSEFGLSTFQYPTDRLLFEETN